MAETTLPVDPEKTGNVWCESCQQSLPAGRAAAHLSSKKHQQSLAPAGEPKKARARAPKARAPAEADEGGEGGEEEPEAQAPAQAQPKAPRAKRTATLGGLTADPSKPGHYWCGICGVSLPAPKAEAHAATVRHTENERRTLASAIRAPRTGGK